MSLPTDKLTDKLYDFQDRVLIGLSHLFKKVSPRDSKIVLSGGTALTRGWLGHRISDDLDFFFKSDRFIRDANLFLKELPHGIGQYIIRDKWDTLVNVDLFSREENMRLRIQLIESQIYYDLEGRGILQGVPLDSIQNIFSEKIAAVLDRMEPKDVADIYAILTLHGGFSVADIIQEAVPKGINVRPLSFCQAIDDFNYASLDNIRWLIDINSKGIEKYMRQVVKEIVKTGDFMAPRVSPPPRPGPNR